MIKRLRVLLVLVLATGASLPGGAVYGQGSATADGIARALVIGQAYVSGNVYVAGFVEDEPRSWPQHIEGVPLQEGRRERIAADFFRTVAQDSEEHYWFPLREADALGDDIFATVDRAAVEDRNLARYRAPTAVDQPVTFLGWDHRLGLVDVSYRTAGELRPVTAAEKKQIASDRKAAPKDFECTTVPQSLDNAKVILTANVASTTLSIRLSKFSNPGCAGHLSDVYVLDVIEPGRDPRTFQFRHYVGVL